MEDVVLKFLLEVLLVKTSHSFVMGAMSVEERAVSEIAYSDPNKKFEYVIR